MNVLERIAYLAATDPTFRQALQADPQAATTAQGLTLSPKEEAALRAVRPLLALVPAELLALLLTVNLPDWTGFPPGSLP